PWHDGYLGRLQQSFGYIFIHPDRGAEHPRAHKRQPSKVEQTLDGAIFAKRAVHHREHYIEALTAAAAVERDQRCIGWVSSHGHALPRAQNLWEHLLSRSTEQPMAFFSNANRHSFVLVGIEPADDGRC